MEPNQMGAAGQPVPEPAPQPTPQPTPIQPTMPTAPDMAAEPAAPAAPEPAMNLEAQMAAEMNEPAQPAAEDLQPAAPAPEPKKKSIAPILGMAFLAVLAIGGIGFGVVMMMQNNDQAASYESQIAQLKKTNNKLMEEIDAQEDLTSDDALVLLAEGATKNQLPYTILNANVTAKYTGEEDKVAYWVKYTAFQNTTPEVITQYNTIFEQDEEGENWTFEIPGFVSTDPRYATLIADYTPIDE